MADIASRDQNRVTTLLGVDSIGFSTPVTVAVNASTHAMIVEASVTPSGTQDVNITKVGGTAFALGQQLATSSLPVVLTTAQINTLTPLTTVAVTQSGSWTVTANPALVASVIVGQYKLTSSAVQLASNVLTNGVIFTAKSTNTGNIFLGGASVNTTADGTGNGYILEPGASTSAAITNTNVYYAIGTANDVLSWVGS